MPTGKQERKKLITQLIAIGVIKDDESVTISITDSRSEEAIEELCQNRLYKQAYNQVIEETIIYINLLS